MRILLSTIFLFLFSFTMLGQGDAPKKSGELKLENYKLPKFDEEPKIEEPKATLGYKSILTKNEDNYLKKFTFKKEEKVQPIMVQNDKGYDFDAERKQQLNIKLDSQLKGSNENISYGKYIVETKRVKILFRDYSEEDGDLIRLIVDDFVVYKSIYLSNVTKEYFIELNPADNFLEFLALNVGMSAPNTASFSVIDDNGKVIFSNDWALNSGVSANFNLYYKIKDDKEKTFEELEAENNKAKSDNTAKKSE